MQNLLLLKSEARNGLYIEFTKEMKWDTVTA